jgi:hypothetical protein
MIVDNLGAVNVPVPPLEADPPLLIDANTVLAEPVAGKRLQMISWDHGQIPKGGRGMKMIEFSFRDAGNGVEPSAKLPSKDLFRFLRPEGSYHGL